MVTAIEHYERLLAQHYTWMTGGIHAAADRAEAAFRALGIAPDGGGRAIDLGAGSGAQTHALTRFGLELWAIDTSAQLLDELRLLDSSERVHCVLGDMTDVTRHCPEDGVDLVVCMGDSILHLRSALEVGNLLTAATACLRPDGEVVVSFRDLSVELKEDSRILPVRSDANHIMSCFLEDFQDYVIGSDIICSRNGDCWKLQKSSYPKLRLGAEELRRMLESTGLRIVNRSVTGGLATLRAKRTRIAGPPSS